MEQLEFLSFAEFQKWAERVVKFKYQRYDRIPKGKQIWTYRDGHVCETGYGKKDGTLVSNLSFILRGIKNSENSNEIKMIRDIDSRGGVTLAISWDE